MPKILKWQQERSEIRYPPPDFKLLTVTLPPKFYKETPKTQLYMSLFPLKCILARHCIDYSMVVELTQEANVHYHAWIKSDKIVYISAAIKKCPQLGFLCISREKAGKSVQDQQQDCYNYLTKKVEETFDILGKKRGTVVHNLRLFKPKPQEDLMISCGVTEVNTECLDNTFIFE